MGRNFARIVAGMGALAGGYVQGKKMHDDQAWEEEKRNQEREQFAREKAARDAAADTLGKVGTESVDPADTGAVLSPAQQTMLAQDVADFGPGAGKSIIDSAARDGATPEARAAAAGVKTAPYTQDQAQGDYVRKMYGIDPNKAMAAEATQMQLEEGRDKADTRKKLKFTDSKLREWGDKNIPKDADGQPMVDSGAMVNMTKMRTLLLMQQGLPDHAMQTAKDGMQYATQKIQMDNAERQAEVQKAMPLLATGTPEGDTAAMAIYNKFVPDGSHATNVIRNKDGSITVERKSAIDGAKLPAGRFKDQAQFIASIQSIADPAALGKYVESTFTHDIESRRIKVSESQLGLEREKVEQGRQQIVQDENGAHVVTMGTKNKPASVVTLEGVGGKAGKSDEKAGKLLDDVRSTVSTNMKGGAFANFDPGLAKKLDKVVEHAGNIVAERQKAGTLKAINSAQVYTEAVKRATGMQAFNTPQDLEAAIKKGDVKKGDKVISPKGVIEIK